MQNRELVEDARSRVRPAPSPGVPLIDIVIGIVVVLAVASLGFFGFRTILSGGGQPAVVSVAAVAPAGWTKADNDACAAKARAAASNPDTGAYLITNRSVAEGVAGLAAMVECELSAKPARFCGHDGNSALVALVNDYFTRMDLVTMGLGLQGAPMAIAGSMLGGEAAAGDAVYQQMLEQTMAFMHGCNDPVLDALRALGRGGVVKADDFRPFMFADVPSHISRIFEGVTVTESVCAV